MTFQSQNEDLTGRSFGVFADNAPAMVGYELAPVPLGADRKPCVSGFNAWPRRPSLRTYEKWCARYPHANIGILPGLSRKKMVADCDTADQVDEVESILGKTELRTLTSDGVHLWYDDAGERLPGNLRKYGLDVDFKRGNEIVIAPPSVHESGHVYRLDGCDWSALKDLRRPNVEALRKFIDAKKPKAERDPNEMRDGSRKQWLNDRLCRHALSCDDPSALLDVARTLNGTLSDPLDDETVVRRAKKVWDDAQAGKLEHWLGGPGIARTGIMEINILSKLNPTVAPDAFMLLMKFRIEHSARCERGETFNINPKGMVRDGSIEGWSRQRYEKARDLLLDANLIDRVSAYRMTAAGRVGAKFKLVSVSRGDGAAAGGRSSYIGAQNAPMAPSTKSNPKSGAQRQCKAKGAKAALGSMPKAKRP